MPIFPRRPCRPIQLCAAAALALSFAASAKAETGVDMLLGSWDWEGKQTAALDGWAGKATATNNQTGEDTNLRYAEFQGRLHTEDMPFMAGVQAKFMGFNSANRALIPQEMHDVAFSLATSLTPKDQAEAFGQKWDVALEAGFGQASSDEAFRDSHGDYATTTLTAGTDTSDTGRLIVGASYDGNRSLWPDIPLIGFEYRNSTGEYINGDKKRPVFAWRVGFPRLGLEWRPDEKWLVEIKADITSLGSAKVEYDLSEHRWFLFGAFRPYRIRVHADGDDAHRRLFFSSDTLETGVRFSPRPGIHLLGAVGYSFNQTIERGWDTQHLQTVNDFKPAPMLRGELRWDF